MSSHPPAQHVVAANLEVVMAWRVTARSASEVFAVTQPNTHVEGELTGWGAASLRKTMGL